MFDGSKMEVFGSHIAKNLGQKFGQKWSLTKNFWAKCSFSVHI